MTLPDYIKNSPVVIIERDYKGEYERFALTPSEFHIKFGHFAYMSNPTGCHQNYMTYPSNIGTTYTLKPMVHMWYKLATIGSDEWNKFFSDMTYNLSGNNITDNNPAYIRSDLMESLTGFCHPYD